MLHCGFRISDLSQPIVYSLLLFYGLSHQMASGLKHSLSVPTLELSSSDLCMDLVPCADPALLTEQGRESSTCSLCWVVALLVKCLACKHEDRYSNPRIHVIPGTTNDSYLQSPGFPKWVGRDRRSPETLRPRQSSLITSNLSERLCCEEVDYVPENDIQDWLTSKYTHTWTSLHCTTGQC